MEKARRRRASFQIESARFEKFQDWMACVGCAPGSSTMSGFWRLTARVSSGLTTKFQMFLETNWARPDAYSGSNGLSIESKNGRGFPYQSGFFLKVVPRLAPYFSKEYGPEPRISSLKSNFS